MITLTLLHPIRSTPVQSWSFEQEPVIRIGRASDNHVILYSAVVSRHHVELRQVETSWEIINLGANGTYLNGKQITQVPVVDGVIIRLARSGPNIQIHLGSAQRSAEEDALAARSQPEAAEAELSQRLPEFALNDEPSDLEQLPLSLNAQQNVQQNDVESTALQAERSQDSVSRATVDDELVFPGEAAPGLDSGPCLHPRASADMVFCPDCGQPLQFLTTVGAYQVIKTLQEDDLGMTQLVWREGQSLLLKTLKVDRSNHPDAVDLFEQQAKTLLHLNHPGIPRFVDFFVVEQQPYLILEQVHGQSLSQYLREQGPLPPSVAIATIQQLCTILDYLHQQSPPFVHQDLRPECLIQRTLAHGNRIMLTGFASLRMLRTNDLEIASYAAPEQQQGQAIPASDLFALGPILSYLVTGQHPRAFYAQREQGFRFYPEYIPGLTPDLAAVIRRLTNPIPEERYATAQEVADALSQVPVLSGAAPDEKL